MGHRERMTHRTKRRSTRSDATIEVLATIAALATIGALASAIF